MTAEQPGEPTVITVSRTDYAPGIENQWQVDMGDTLHMGFHDIDDALLLVRVVMQRIESEQVHR